MNDGVKIGWGGRGCRVVLAVAVWLGVYCCIPCPGENVDGGGEYRVARVIDGDTIELANGRRVRYIGIDTPETMRKRGRVWEFAPERFAVEAKEYNRALVSGKVVRLEFDRVKEDKYGRWLAYVYDADNTMVNAELLRKGYAVLYTIPPNDKHMDLLIAAQEDARRNGLGLWKDLKPDG
ncbi:MAG: thermonuclease family protein [Candidatus Omnitrophota bacterium]